jgi:hypothetical protein
MLAAKDTIEEEGEVSLANSSLAKYFLDANVGTVDCPAVIIDIHSRILIYHLPGIMQGRIV